MTTWNAKAGERMELASTDATSWQPAWLGRTTTIMHAGIGERIDRIGQIRRGVPARKLGELAGMLGVSKDALTEHLGLARATVNRKAAKDETLSRYESELVLGIQSLLDLVQSMIASSTDRSADRFDHGHWLGQWLNAQIPALNGARPATYLDTVEGQKLVARILSTIASGAYA
jgi:uncharacterized protein (DUF2384 family)